MRFFQVLVYIAVLLCTLACSSPEKRGVISLAGQWEFALEQDGAPINDIAFSDVVTLPGTTDTNKKGLQNTDSTQTTYLSRAYSYVGEAWYARPVNIPKAWSGKKIELILERTKATTVWVNQVEVGSCDDISTSQRYDLTDLLTPGEHTITIRVDNSAKRLPKHILGSSHACTESTQTNWNGIIGDIELVAKNKSNIEAVKISPDAKNKRAKIVVTLNGSQHLDKGTNLVVRAESWNGTTKHTVSPIVVPVQIGSDSVVVDFAMGDNALTWSEFEPNLYRLEVTLEGYDQCVENFGLRDFSTNGSHFTINQTQTFLRGKHDACVFPLTAHTPMDLEQWRRYFQICKEYGINHCRFHSWCPPQACFDAADIEGIYLQPELPFWGGFKRSEERLVEFLKDEGVNIQSEYGNHASFVMFALGNELSGDLDLMQEFVADFRAIDSRHLYAYGSNNYLGTKGQIEGEDFLVTCRVGNGTKYETHTRGSFSFADALQGGYINNTYPNSVMNFDAALDSCSIPVISHETGQFQVYPNYQEMAKYTGVLKPVNFNVFKERLTQAGMENQAADFFSASGRWAAELYKADIEMDLRTAKMAGFQLLDLQDYPGQGSAYVGILDAFMDNKGIISAERWRGFCNRVVPLLVTERFCWSNDEDFMGTIKIANYGGESLKGKCVEWSLDGVKSGSAVIESEKQGLIEVVNLNIDLEGVDTAEQIELTLRLPDTDYKNSYSIWVYPRTQTPTGNAIIINGPLNGALSSKLKDGNRVVWFPASDIGKDLTVDALFQTDYWNYRMFKNICDRIGKPASPGTLGLLMNPQHPLFENFPTEMHTNWQWYSIVKNSYPMILNNLPDEYRPIVQVIDNVERNHKLGLVYEFDVNGSKLLVCMSDIRTEMSKPEVAQFYNALVSYVNSDKFNPQTRLSAQQLGALFSATIEQGEVKELKNISYE